MIAGPRQSCTRLDGAEHQCLSTVAAATRTTVVGDGGDGGDGNDDGECGSVPQWASYASASCTHASSLQTHSPPVKRPHKFKRA